MDFQAWVVSKQPGVEQGASFREPQGKKTPVKKTPNVHCQLVLAGQKPQRVEILIAEGEQDD